MKEHKQFSDTPQRKTIQPEVCPHWPKALVSIIYGKYQTYTMEKELSNGKKKHM